MGGGESVAPLLQLQMLVVIQAFAQNYMTDP